jgi:hypothetical protein
MAPRGLPRAWAEQDTLCALAARRPVARVALASREAREACPCLRAAWWLDQATDALLRGEPLWPACQWCGTATGNWCEGAPGRVCTGEHTHLGARALCTGCEELHGACRTCLGGR